VVQNANWGLLGRISVTFGLVAAVVVYFAVPDKRWISAVLLGMAILDAFIYGIVLPRLTGSSGAPSLSDLEEMNAEADRASASDDDWDQTKKPDDV